MDIIKTASAAKTASMRKTADTPGSPYRKGTGAMPAFPGRYTRMPGGVVKTAPRTMGYSQARPAAVSVGKDPVDINAQGIAVANQNNTTNLANEAAAKAVDNSMKRQNATLARGTIQNYKPTATNPNPTGARVMDEAGRIQGNKMVRGINSNTVDASKLGFFDRIYANAAKPRGSKYVDVRDAKQLADATKGARLGAWLHWAGAFVPGGKSPAQARDDYLNDYVDTHSVNPKTGFSYRQAVQAFGTNISQDDPADYKPTHPNDMTTDRQGNEKFFYRPKQHSVEPNGTIAPTFNDFNHDVKTRADSILSNFDIGGQYTSRNTDLEEKGQALLRNIADIRSNPAMVDENGKWTPAAYERVKQDPDFQDMYRAAKQIKPWLSVDGFANIWMANGSRLIYTK